MSDWMSACGIGSRVNEGAGGVLLLCVCGNVRETWVYLCMCLRVCVCVCLHSCACVFDHFPIRVVERQIKAHCTICLFKFNQASLQSRQGDRWLYESVITWLIG